MRLSADEAASLVVGLSLLEALDGSGVPESEALQRVAYKLRAAAGSAVADLADSVQVRMEDDSRAEQARATCSEALEDSQRLHLRYLHGYFDRVDDREVDPMGLVVEGGHTFLEGYCRLRRDVRFFRLDRVLDLHVLPFAAEIPEGVTRRDLSEGVLQRSEADAVITLDLDPGARWVTEDYVCESVTDLPDGGVRATLRTPAPAWVARLSLLLGPQARVVTPGSLAEEVHNEAVRALGHYETTQTSPGAVETTS